MLVMISANDLISLYLGLELQSLAAYVVAAIHRDDARSTEAGLKYFVLGALSSGMLLYGASLVYGFTGHTGFEPIAAALADGRSARPGLRPGLRARRPRLQDLRGAVPHVDARRLRGRADAGHRLLRLRAEARGAWRCSSASSSRPSRRSPPTGSRSSPSSRSPRWLLGAFAAIGQSNIKRLMAYSSIGHMGYALVGLAAGTEQGVQGVIIYIVIYMAMTLGAFACILAMRRGGDDGRGHRRARRAGAHQAGDGLPASRRSSSRSPAFRRSPASSPSTTSSSPRSRRGSMRSR